MPDFYVPVIHETNGDKCLYRLLVSVQTGSLADFSVCGRAKGQGNEAVDCIIDKAASCLGTVPKVAVHLMNLNGVDCLSASKISSGTQSISLGIITAIEYITKGRQLNAAWDSIVITGDYDCQSGELLQVGRIEDKAEALARFADRNPAAQVLFVYVSDSPLPERVTSCFAGNVSFCPIPAGTKAADYWAELFKPEFDGAQRRFLDRALLFDRSAPFVRNEQFKAAQKEARTEDWKGYFIYGEGESGKTSFAYRLCCYLMSVGAYYAPLWVSVDPSSGMNALAHSADSKYNGLTRAICDQLLPFWKDLDGLAQVYELLCSRNYLLVIDNLELQSCGLLEGILKETFSALKMQLPVIITSRYGDGAPSLEKACSIRNIRTGRFSFEQCREVMLGSNPDFALIDQHKQDALVAALLEQYADAPGVMAFAAKMAAPDSADDVLRSLEEQGGLLQDYMAGLVRESFLQLPEQAKGFLYCFVRKCAEKRGFLPDTGSSRTSTASSQAHTGSPREHAARLLRPSDFEDEFAFDAIEADLRTLRSLNFIYELDGEAYWMKSSLYRILIVHDFGFAGKDRFIDIKMQLHTAVTVYQERPLVDRFLHRLRDSGAGSPEYIESLLSDAVLFGSGTDLLELLLDEVERYGGTRKGAIGYGLLKTAMNWSGDSSVLAMLIRNGGDPCACDEDGDSLLHGIYRHVPAFEAKCDLLLKQGLHINGKNPMGVTALHSVTEFGDAGQMAHLIRRGADVNARNGFGLTALHIAVQQEDEEKVRLLLENGADRDARDANGYVPLHFALHSFPVFSCLLAYGADIQAKTADGESLLDLLELGPYIDCTVDVFKNSGKLVCYGAGFMEKFKNEQRIYELLTASKVSRCFRPKGFKENWFSDRLAAWNFICSQDRLFVDVMTKPLDLLADRLALADNLLRRDDDGNSLLHCSVLNPDISVSRYLLDQGLGANLRNDEGETPLLVAARYASGKKVLQLLLEYGADMTACDNDGNGVLHCAAVNPCEDMAEYLLDSGCGRDTRNAQGFLPIGRAAAWNPNPIVFCTFAFKATMEELERSYFDGMNYVPAGLILFACNKFCSTTVLRFQAVDRENCDYERIASWGKQWLPSQYEDEQASSFMADYVNDEGLQKEQLDSALAFASGNDNPKLPVLWARLGGNLSQTNGDGETVLAVLKGRDDWKYIQRQLQKHGLIDKADQIIRIGR